MLDSTDIIGVAEGGDDTAAPSRIERKKREKLSAIKRAARELFAKKGFKSATTREIAEHADIGTGTLFLYTTSKEELLVEIFIEELGETLNEAFATTCADDHLLEQILHIFFALVRYHDPDRELGRVFVKELLFVERKLNQRVAAFFDGIYQRMTAIIARAQERGELSREVPARPLARNLFALYLFTLKKWLAGDYPRQDCERWLRESLGLHLCCVAPIKDPRVSPVRRARRAAKGGTANRRR
ncbi:MAG: TetR/AcrR family transcriptional regulator [Candidatus Binataceae bacterium]